MYAVFLCRTFAFPTINMNLLHDFYIIESLTGRDIFDGKILYDALLSTKKFSPIYTVVSNAGEFENALKDFERSTYRYLLISAHGDQENIYLVDDSVNAEDISEMNIELYRRRIFMSTCEGGSTLFGRHFIKKRAYSVVGAPDKLAQIVAVGMWTTMMVVFNSLSDEELNFSELDTTLALMAAVYRIELHYYSFRRKHKNKMKEYIYRPSGKRIRNDHDI